MSRVRSSAIVVHRWVGLAMAVFLLVAGLTGSVLAFYRELDAALNPELLKARPPSAGAALLDPLELRERLAKQLPPASAPEGLVLDVRPGRAVSYWIDERETFVDPYSGQVLGSRKFGDLTEGKKNLLTFVYRFHYSMALGTVGTWIFGIVASLWVIDCVVGAYLTFPLRAETKQGRARKPWLVRWSRSWLLRTTKLFSLVFTWHRASGLWVWGMFLVFAWSGVALNLGAEVYKPVMKLVLPLPTEAESPLLPQPRVARLGWREALAQGRVLMRAEAQRRGFTILGERWLNYDDKRGLYQYTVDSTRDVHERLADTIVTFDGDDGALRGFTAATGQSARGTFDTWLIALHFGAVRRLGTAYRVFVSVMGVVVVTLTVTGVWIWWRKRSKRARAEQLLGGEI